jgi:hypothetical protein
VELPNVAVGPDPESWQEFVERVPRLVARYIADLIHSATAEGVNPAAAARLKERGSRRAALARSEGRGYGPAFAKAVTALAASGLSGRSDGHA